LLLFLTIFNRIDKIRPFAQLILMYLTSYYSVLVAVIEDIS